MVKWLKGLIMFGARSVDFLLWVKPEDTGELLRGLQCCMDHHRELIDRCSRENYRIVLENYTWDAVAGKYLEYLKSIVVK